MRTSRATGAQKVRPAHALAYRAAGRGARRAGAQKGMFYNEPNQRRALTLAARTNGRARARAQAAIQFLAREEHFFGFIASVNPEGWGTCASTFRRNRKLIFAFVDAAVDATRRAAR